MNFLVVRVSFFLGDLMSSNWQVARKQRKDVLTFDRKEKKGQVKKQKKTGLAGATRALNRR